MSEIEYFYSAHSAFAYLGSARLMEIAEAGGRSIVHRPMDLRAVVSAEKPDGFGKRSKAHLNYYFGREIERWAQYRGVAFKGGVPGNHYNDMTLANCMMIAGQTRSGNVDRLAHGMLQAHWREHGDLADRDLLAQIATAAGFEAEPLIAAARGDEAKAVYRANTADAIARSVFGSPTYVVDGDMFYGQDHLEMIERAMRQPFAYTWPEL